MKVVRIGSLLPLPSAAGDRRKWDPRRLWEKTGIPRDIRLGFTTCEDAIRFQAQWG